MGAGGIFISYRRDDAYAEAGRIAQEMERAFGPGNVFLDLGDMLGEPYLAALDQCLSGCSVMLVLIGPRWLYVRDANGRRRLDDVEDAVRLEVATAFNRHVRVLPVLLDGAAMPPAFDLPADMQQLVRMVPVGIGREHFQDDIARLVGELQRDPVFAAMRGDAPKPAAAMRPARRWPVWSAAALAAVVVAGVGLSFTQRTGLQEAALTPAELLLRDPTSAGSSQGTAVAPRDVSGDWRTPAGENFHIEQDGASLRIEVTRGGQPIGEGSGALQGEAIVATVTLPVNGADTSSHCTLKANPDGNSMQGVCENAAGSFPTQMYR